MKSYSKVFLQTLTMSIAVLLASSQLFAAEKRCTAQGKKVECPVQSDKALLAAQEAYEKEATDMAEGKAGSTYGIAPFDYLTGVGKRTEGTTLSEGDSGYGDSSTGRTELWDRVANASEGEAIYNQWTNNWSPSFDETLVAGADPNEGKQWYYVYCITCHGWTLQGDGPSALAIDPKPRILTAGNKYMNQKTNLELFTAIKGGGEAVSLSSSMPAWGNFLMDQDIWNIVAWIRAMSDVGQPKSIEEYLNPKSSYQMSASDVNPLNVKENEDFLDAQEMMEIDLGGRGGGALVGGGYVEGGLRKKPEDVADKVGKKY
ncbi:MAG: cytochrome c [Gammaproteobacteria bacterium]|jgi:cytochrome c oxidase cbb3-type subunit III|nr:cytochrome c [Gammaproteobacteria bacterium]MBT4493863.1 cytochrome c [Gammaproteobacteria bacterium]